MIWAFEVDSPHADFAQRCFALALKYELLLRPMGNTVYVMPPYIITEAETEWLLTKILTVVDQLS
jgi:adenosylmethionine-8-amino-7-oxononanoate aminotransferase